MRFTITIIGFLFSLLSEETVAQVFIELNAGISVNYFHTDISNRVTSRIKPHAGYCVGGAMEFLINQNFGFKTGISHLTKNYLIVRTDSLSGAYTLFVNSYLQIPVELNFSFFKSEKFNCSVRGGLFVSYWIAGRIKGRIHNILDSYSTITGSGQVIQNINLTPFSQVYNFDNNKDNRLENGLCVGTDVKYCVGKKYRIMFSATFLNSLTSQIKREGINSINKINRTLLISLAVLIDFNNN